MTIDGGGKCVENVTTGDEPRLSIKGRAAMSFADLKRVEQQGSSRGFSACQSRIDMAIAALSIGFIVVLLVAL